MTTTLPSGTATGNADAVRQGTIAPSFFLFKDILAGVDSEPRMQAGMTGSNLLGPASSFGVDFGLDSTGDLFIRGRAAADDAPPRNTATDGLAATSVQVPRVLMYAGLALAAYVAYKLLK